MNEIHEFRLEPYQDQEVAAALHELFGYQSLVAGMYSFLPQDLAKTILKKKDNIDNVYDFQKEIIHPFLKFIEQISISDLTASGLEQLDPSDKYLFISNHRDIVLDSAFLNNVLFENDIQTSQIAIGDNLMVHRLSELLFRLNKSFVVKRTGAPRELYSCSVRMSAYIRDLIVNKEDSVWIAQREGRAKDGDDKTQVGLLKMLSLAAKNGFKEYLKDLNIVPLSISYEYDPCDMLKTKEFLEKQANPNYKKPFQEDVKHILHGLKGAKGRVHFSFGQPLNEALDVFDEVTNCKKQLEVLAQLIDTAIHLNYKLRPVHFIAHDLLTSSSTYAAQYSQEEWERESQLFQQKLQVLTPEEQEAGRNYLLKMYANPVINARIAASKKQNC